MNPIILFLGLALLIGLVLMALFGSAGSIPAAQKRLKSFTDLDHEIQRNITSTLMGGSPEVQGGSWSGTPSNLARKKGDRSESLLLGGGDAKKQLVLLAGVLVVSAVVMVMVSRSLLPAQAQNLLPLGILFLLIPRWFVIIKHGRLRKKFSEQFPSAIRMMMNSLRAGHDIRSSFEMVSEEMPSPIKEEFAHVLRELNVGVNLEAALKNLEKRLKIPDVKIFVVGVLMNSKLGGNLTEILQKLEYTMRERIRLRKEIKSLTSQAQASATLLTALVPVLSAVLFATNRDYMSVLWTTKAGIQILLGVYVAVGFGAFILFRMCNVKME